MLRSIEISCAAHFTKNLKTVAVFGNYPRVSGSRSPNDSNSNRQEWINISTKPNSPAYHWDGILHGEWYETRELKVMKWKFRLLFLVVNMLTDMAAFPVVDQHCPCADMTWWNLMNRLFKLCLGNTKMFTSQKIGRMVFIYFNFNKILTHANAIDRMHMNARKNELLITFLPALF